MPLHLHWSDHFQFIDLNSHSFEILDQIACNITICPIARCKWIWQNTALGQAEQDPDLPRSSSNVLGKVQCQSPLFNGVVGQVEVQVGQVNLRGSLPCSENNVLQTMLHPAKAFVLPDSDL